MTDQLPQSRPPTHSSGCRCAGCEAERTALDRSVAILRAAGEIPPEVVGTD